MSGNDNLNAARDGATDEFYTQMPEVENEMAHYREHFKGRKVYCNCDGIKSNFFRYFVREFDSLGLKRVTATRMADGATPDARGSGAEFFGGRGGSVRAFNLRGDGDFRSRECMDILGESDVVATNPPFSLFGEHLAALMESGVKFAVMGNMNAASTKAVFPLFRDGKVWFGPSLRGSRIWFEVPWRYPLTGPDAEVRNGSKFVKMKGVVRWFTNMGHGERNRGIPLTRTFDEDRNPKYLNHDAVEVGAIRDIPADYPGVMGVPVTILDRHDPDQFEIVGIACRGKDVPLLPDESGTPRRVYSRILIRNRKPGPPAEAEGPR